MKPFEELSRLGRIRRMRQLAQVALNAYGLSDVRFKLLRQAGNTLFRVNEVDPVPTTKAELYTQGQYLLRIHLPRYQTTEAIELELAWLAAMCRDANLPVPEPVPTPDGHLLTRVSIPGIPGERDCSLYRWVKGHLITKDVQPHHYRAQGRLMARLHGFAAHWPSPPVPTKRKYDWDGLFRDAAGVYTSGRETWSLLPQEYVEPFEVVTRRVKQVERPAPSTLMIPVLDTTSTSCLLLWSTARKMMRCLSFGTLCSMDTPRSVPYQKIN